MADSAIVRVLAQYIDALLPTSTLAYAPADATYNGAALPAPAGYIQRRVKVASGATVLLDTSTSTTLSTMQLLIATNIGTGKIDIAWLAGAVTCITPLPVGATIVVPGPLPLVTPPSARGNYAAASLVDFYMLFS